MIRMITKCKWVIKRRSSHVLQVFIFVDDKKQVMWHCCENSCLLRQKSKQLSFLINLLALTLIGNWGNLSGKSIRLYCQ